MTPLTGCRMSIDPEYFEPICEDCTPGPLGSTICDPSDPERIHCPYRVPDDDEPTTPLTHRYPDSDDRICPLCGRVMKRDGAGCVCDDPLPSPRPPLTRRYPDAEAVA